MNIQLKKFYDAAIAEPATNVAEPQSTNIAALMAKHGVTNSSDQMVATPVLINPERKEEPVPAPEASPAAMASEPSPAAPANPESPTPTPEPSPTPAQIAQEPVKVPTWQEVLKNQQPGTILKELGYDEKVVNELKELDPKMISFLNRWKSGEDLVPFLRELTTDYSKLSAEDVMRHQLRQEYPKANQAQLEALFKREVIKAYSLDSDDELERSEGLELLAAKAEKHRDSLIQNQQNFLFPQPPEPKEPEPDLRAMAADRNFQAYQSQLNESPYTKNILSTKQLSIGDGNEKFNYPVEPNDLLKVLSDDDEWGRCLFDIKDNPDGTKTFTPDVEKQFLVAGVMKYGKDFLNKYAEHYKTIGAKSATAIIENATPPGNNTPAASQAPPKTPAEAMARMGRLV